MATLKTPLRYPGGKSRAITKLFAHLPDMSNITEYREPFLGGGSMAIAITQKYPDIKVWVNDLYSPLVNFWSILQSQPDALVSILKVYKEEYFESETEENRTSPKQLFLILKENLHDLQNDAISRAAAFYFLNKNSFSGLTENSSFSAQANVSNFSMAGIERLLEFSTLIQNWNITNLSYENLLQGDPSVFVYADPPYDIKDNLYGTNGDMHKGFDHDLFASRMNFCHSQCMVSYNSSNPILERFKEWNAVEFDLTYTMRSVGDYMEEQEERKELLLLNYGS